MTVITAEAVERAQGVLRIGRRDIVTPLAADRAKERGIQILRDDAPGPAPLTAPAARTDREERAAPLSSPPSGALYRRGAPVASGRGSSGRPVAAVIGAGHVGAMTALRLAESSAFERVALLDIVPGLGAGLALDMWHSAGLRGFTTRIEGGTDPDLLRGADFVVMTAGKPRQPGMSRTDLTAVNAEVIRASAGAVRDRAPGAVVVVVTNPLEEMTHLMARCTGFPPERVVGMAGVLDGARFCALVGLTGVARPQDVRALALGSHGAEMVIPLSQATANGTPVERLLARSQLDAIVERTRDSGAEIVALLQTGSAYFSPADSAARMVLTMARGDPELLAACVQSGGRYGLPDTRLGLPVRLGRTGVAEIVALPLREDELAALRRAADSIAARIGQLGQR